MVTFIYVCQAQWLSQIVRFATLTLIYVICTLLATATDNADHALSTAPIERIHTFFRLVVAGQFIYYGLNGGCGIIIYLQLHVIRLAMQRLQPKSLDAEENRDISRVYYSGLDVIKHRTEAINPGLKWNKLFAIIYCYYCRVVMNQQEQRKTLLVFGEAMSRTVLSLSHNHYPP